MWIVSPLISFVDFIFFFIFQVVLELSFSLVFNLLCFLFQVLGLVWMSS